MSPNTAPIKWAQRSDSLYVTIALSGTSDTVVLLAARASGQTGIRDLRPGERNVLML